MLLKTLLREAGAGFPSNQIVAEDIPDIVVSGVQVDSRKVAKGNLFLAVKGSNQDGNRFIPDALANGACAVLTDGHYHGMKDGAFVHEVPGLRTLVAPLLNVWFGKPAEKLFCIGVTGTNGKSTITKLSSSMLQACGRKVISLGTIDYEIGGQKFPSGLTTPGPVEFFELLRKGVEAGCDTLVMEVSSHALSQDRVGAVGFSRAIFTNLTQDHLDYHKDMEEYYEAKRKLFRERLLPEGIAILNLDSPYGRRLAREAGRPVMGFSRSDGIQEGMRPEVALISSRLSLEGTRLEAGAALAAHIFESRLIGNLNLENLLAVIALGFSMGLNPRLMAEGIKGVSVLGRNQVLPLPNGAMAVVDYAHTPDALQRILESLKPLCRGKLSCLFGCGGDRDRGKRPLMGEIAARLADKVYLTSDNPRTEEPRAILNEILMGIEKQGDVTVIENRRSAIHAALSELKSGECLLIAGKGHENYQVVGGERIHFSDQEEVAGWILSQVPGTEGRIGRPDGPENGN